MDKRSWPWKKKSSEKQAAAASDLSTAASDLGSTQLDKVKQESSKKPKYVQISVESYTHLTGLEDQVKSYEGQVTNLEDEVKELREKLSEAHSEITNKENLVKQHAKVAEEAVSGWEKAEEEAAALKNHLESVTLLKVTAEDRASHLDGALKECMWQIRTLKEEHEQKLHEVVVNKGKLFDKMKLELETRIGNLDQELLRSAAESDALSRSLQERSSILIKISEDKAQAEAQIELLTSNIESCEKEINSLKYELHIARKEVEIRNEEKNMSVRSAEVANKHHLEGVKKIAKLEAECQRLRGLVRKKLPGPAALAQMKLEVESLGRDYGDSRSNRRSVVKPPTQHLSQLPDFSLDNAQKYQKENKLLTERLLAMEEETKMLKEALAKRNSELQASRSVYAQTANKLLSLEAQLQANSGASSLISNAPVHVDSFYNHRASHPPSFTSMSEEGHVDTISCSASWATGLMSDFSHLKKDKNFDSPCKSENASRLDLLDDFLEMEKLANLSEVSNGTSDVSGRPGNTGIEVIKHDALPEVFTRKDKVTVNSELQTDSITFAKFQTKISMALGALSKEKDMEKAVEVISRVLMDVHDSSGVFTDIQSPGDDADIIAAKEMSLTEVGSSCIQTINEEMKASISQIYEFLMILGKEANAVPDVSPDEDGLQQKLDMFSAKYSQAMNSEINFIDFVVDISNVLSKARELHFNFLGFKNSEVDAGISDCIDKIALPENKAIVDLSGERYSNVCAHFSDSTSDPDIPNDGNLVPTSESTAASWKCSSEEFEQLKMDRDNLAVDLARYTENFERTKSQLLETERLLGEVQSQLASSQKLNSLADTQLKCMAESYKSLETRTEELQTEVNLLQGKLESLGNELEEERKNHQETLARCKDQEEQMQSLKGADKEDNSTNQEKELAAAAEKLAECQETIFLLGKQLKALHPPSDILSSPSNRTSQKVDGFIEEEPTISGNIFQDVDSYEMDVATSFNLRRANSESPLDLFGTPFGPSDTEANNLLTSPVSSKYPKHRPTKSVSSTASSTPTPEKQARGFSRFFSSKGQNGQ